MVIIRCTILFKNEDQQAKILALKFGSNLDFSKVIGSLELSPIQNAKKHNS